MYSVWPSHQTPKVRQNPQPLTSTCPVKPHDFKQHALDVSKQKQIQHQDKRCLENQDILKQWEHVGLVIQKQLQKHESEWSRLDPLDSFSRHQSKMQQDVQGMIPLVLESFKEPHSSPLLVSSEPQAWVLNTYIRPESLWLDHMLPGAGKSFLSWLQDFAKTIQDLAPYIEKMTGQESFLKAKEIGLITWKKLICDLKEHYGLWMNQIEDALKAQERKLETSFEQNNLAVKSWYNNPEYTVEARTKQYEEELMRDAFEKKREEADRQMLLNYLSQIKK